jgi:hypothetical protein
MLRGGEGFVLRSKRSTEAGTFSESEQRVKIPRKGGNRPMFERLLLFGLMIVVIGLCIGALAIFWLAADVTISLWRQARAPRACVGCERLGRRCPWCRDDWWRGVVTTLAVPLPEVAWPIMVGSHIAFSRRAQVATAAWAFAHLTLALMLFLPV